MPARLVYAPKVWVYTKNQNGDILNLSNWVTSGQVNRLINQVSTATVTLRNPFKRFTTPSSGVAFHPMDPITIYLERLEGFPVRVFTGYLDITPYYQMYPGTITLQASCTLKRLLYTYFDPALPFMFEFFAKYGWTSTGTGAVYNANALGHVQSIDSSNLQDSSIGKLLWATLFEIGDWQDTNIYVENLPDGIAQRMATLMTTLQKEQQTASDEVTAFMNQVVGYGSQGTGGGNGGGSSGSVPNNVRDAWLKAERQQETGYPNGNYKQNSAGCLGAYCWLIQSYWATEANAAGYGKYANTPVYNVPGSVQDAVAWHHMSQWADKGQWAQAAIDWNAGNPNANDPSYAQGVISKFTVILKQMGLSYPPKLNPTQPVHPNSNSNSSNPPPQSRQDKRVNPRTKNTTNSPVQHSTSNSANKSSGSSNKKQNAVACPIPGWIRSRDDMGVDASGPGKPIYAPAGIDFVGTTGGWLPLLYLYKFNPPLSGTYKNCQYFYVAEGCGTPGKHHYNVGEQMSTGTGSIEMGWGSPTAGTRTLAGEAGYSGNNLPPGTGTENGDVYGRTFREYFGIVGAMNQVIKAGPGKGIVGGGGGGAGGGGQSTNTAEAFVAELEFPTVEDMVVAVALGSEHKGLMHDQSLMPFVQELCQASLRSFQSLPNGDFYAFYPDYFGEFGHHPPYWMVEDIEILEGAINLTDDALATHVYAVGDNTWAVGSPENELMNMLFSAGDINIFNAFLDPSIVDTSTDPHKGGAASIMSEQEAVKFVERYGARPLVLNVPQVRSSIFEMLLAYQQFMLAWSNQFRTPFTFTFMPEVFPGGKIGFPNHGIQMYVNSVTHSWDYAEAGFQTTCELSAPSLLPGVDAANFPDLPPHMIRALVEPVQGGPPGTASSSSTGHGLSTLGSDISSMLTNPGG